MSQEPAPPTLGLRQARTFDDIVGQAAAVEGLRKRVRTGHQTIGVILHGPGNVGKRTLARLYAKAVLCERPTEAGSFCASCPACQRFDKSPSADDIVLTMAQGDAEERAKYLNWATQHHPWGDRRVITILEADATPPPAFDRLLPTLEKAGMSTTFILLACDLKDVRLAGVSRCDAYRLRPLAPCVARGLLAPRLAELGTVPDGNALDVLVAAGRGLPGQLDHICTKVAGMGALTLEAAREALDLDWVDEMAARWRAMLTGKAPVTDTLAPAANVTPGEQARRMQVLLQYIYIHSLQGMPVSAATADPAFLHRGDALAKELIQALVRCADVRGSSVEDLWDTLAQRCLSGDLVGPDSEFPL